MHIKVSCGCGRAYRLRSELAGKRVKCKDCGNSFEVPAVAASGDQDRSAAHSATDRTTDGAQGLDGYELQHVPEVPRNRCSNCGSDVQPEAVLCIQCGFNLKTGAQIKTIREVEEGEYRLSGGPLHTALTLVGAFFLFVGMLTMIVALNEENGALALAIGVLIALSGAFVCTCGVLTKSVVSVERAVNGGAEIIKSIGIGPMQVASRYSSAEYEAVWFVQTAKKSQGKHTTILLVIMLLLFCMGGIPGLIWWFLLLRGGDDTDVGYRVELRQKDQRPVVLLSGGENAKYDANAVSKLVRDATGLRLEQDLGLVS